MLFLTEDYTDIYECTLYECTNVATFFTQILLNSNTEEKERQTLTLYFFQKMSRNIGSDCLNCGKRMEFICYLLAVSDI
jgi:hypothetical protein